MAERSLMLFGDSFALLKGEYVSRCELAPESLHDN